MTKKNLIQLGAMVLFLYLAMEWLFLGTKPSFLSPMSPLSKGGVLATSYILTAVPFLALLLGVYLVSARAALSVVAVLLGMLFFLLADNFLYTIFHLGTLGSPDAYRIFYTLLFVALVWLSYYQLRVMRLNSRLLPYSVLSIMIPTFLLYAGAKAVDSAQARDNKLATLEGRISDRPNILLIGVDGVEADLFSVYRSTYDTTPFLQSISDELLVFENAFPDAGKTTGTTTAILTGRSPLDTHVGFPPQVLLGEDSFRHLPALLNELGYHGYQQAVSYYADAVSLNFRNSFLEVNRRNPPFYEWRGTACLHWLNNELFFLQRLYDRLISRLRYVSFVDDMVNQYRVVTENRGLGFDYDRSGIEGLLRFIRIEGTPFYAHLHLMSTHCCRQSPESTTFSSKDFPSADAQSAALAADRLNAIRDVDTLIRYIYQAFKGQDILEDTILVIYSDHSYDSDTIERVPLLLRFPNGAKAGRYSPGVLLSMVPGLLAKRLGINHPTWMRPPPKLDLLAADGDEGVTGPLFALSSFDYFPTAIGANGLAQWKITDPGPPNYGIRDISLVLCSRWYKASLANERIQSGLIRGHTAPCADAEAPRWRDVLFLFQKEIERRGLVWGG